MAEPRYADQNLNSPDPSLEQFDIGLLALNAPAPEGFVPAVLLTDASQFHTDMAVQIVGFGPNSSERKDGSLNLRTMNGETKTLDETKLQVTLQDSLHNSITPGDSGGGAFVEIGQNEYLWGISSAVAVNKTGLGNGQSMSIEPAPPTIGTHPTTEQTK